MKDPRPRAAKIRDAVAAESDAWDRATERRADTEYALEQFEESPEFDGTSERFDNCRRQSTRLGKKNARPSALGVERWSARSEVG